jgi:hypothetical protein
MKLEYLDDITGNGKYPRADPDKLIRLYDFDQKETRQLIDIIQSDLISGKGPLDLSVISFIKSINCNLRFEIAEMDYGIDLPIFRNDFVCKLTIQTYKNMVGYMNAFSEQESSLDGYNWLYDPPGDKIDLLFSPGGTW